MREMSGWDWAEGTIWASCPGAVNCAMRGDGQKEVSARETGTLLLWPVPAPPPPPGGAVFL